MNCSEVRDLQILLVEDCLEPEARVHVEAHLAVCSSCTALLTTELEVKKAVAGLVTEAPESLRRSVSSLGGRRRRRLRPAWAALAAALALISATVMVLAAPLFEGHRPEPPQPVTLAGALNDYEGHWAGMSKSPAPHGLPDLSREGLDRWSTDEITVAGKAVPVTRYSGKAGKVAVYRFRARLTQPSGSKPVGLPQGEGSWALTDEHGDYETLVWNTRDGGLILIGTLQLEELVELSPRFESPE